MSGLDNTSDDFVAMLARQAIRARISEYVDALNQRDWVRYADTLCEDLVWGIGAPFDAKVSGRTAMLDIVQNLDYQFSFQMEHGVVIEHVTGDTARAHHTLVEFTDQFHMIGIYYDEMRKEADGIWRFAKREFLPTYFDKSHPPGSNYGKLPVEP